MATIFLAAAGAALGASFGGTVLGLSGAVIGRSIGASLGRSIDQRILGLGSDAIDVGKVDRLSIMGSNEGAPIPKIWGRIRVAGQVIWTSPFKEVRRRKGGKGVPSPKTNTFSYSVSLAIALCEGTILGIDRIWADGDEISAESLNLRVYLGTDVQLPDALIESIEGVGEAPAYRGLAYVLIEDFDLSPYGNRVPQLRFEVLRRANPSINNEILDLQDVIRGVSIIPGTGEYTLATQKLRRELNFGSFRIVNSSTRSGKADFDKSMEQLSRELPNCTSTALVVSWFGDDLRCNFCKIQPKVENLTDNIAEIGWRAGGIDRSQAKLVPRLNGRPISGGTPADSSVMQAIQSLSQSGKSVMFYPFVMMDQLSDNILTNPYNISENQPAIPWRGRITLSVAPGSAQSSDATSAATDEVEKFFGTARVEDFKIIEGNIIYTGDDDWGYRRFILHYAHLCKLCGGVESFCIGSELRGITRIRGDSHSFPAVDFLVQLAADVRSVLGSLVKISYAADWSEYFGYHVDGNVYFNLDQLWADSNIDFVGIDNYMPISDWRESESHLDADWGSIYNLDYLISNISGGEGYDWYYSDDVARRTQKRSVIDVTSCENDWVFRFKDIKSWWSKSHFERLSGDEASVPTAWIPQSKPIRFTEYGCAAVDKGSNEPNKFVDLYSSESSLPVGSSGQRDDLIQMQYYRAMGKFWNSLDNNPVSTLYGETMVDLSHCYAWAWDARPYPEFPRNQETWADGNSYYAGHWLNGRASSVPLDRVVAELCSDSQVLSTNTSSLFGLVHGFSSTENQSTRARLQPLFVLNGCDCFDKEGEIVFTSRASTQTTLIDQSFLAVSDDMSSNLEYTRSSITEKVGRVRLSFFEADSDFGNVVVEMGGENSYNFTVMDSDYSGVLPRVVAKGIVSRWLAEAELSAETIKFSLPPSYSYLVPGVLVKIKDVIYRVDHIETSSVITIQAVRVDPAVYTVSDKEFDDRRFWPTVTSGGVSFLWLDLPMLKGSQDPHAPYIAVSSIPWPGSVTVWSSDSMSDSDYNVNTVILEPASVGVTVSQLDFCKSGVLDRGDPLQVHFPHYPLEAVSLNSLFNGRNLVAIGDGTPSNWEIFQFLKSELVSADTYALSLRLRGQFGTDHFIPEVWPSGSFFVVLDEGLSQIMLSPEYRNVPRSYRIGSAEMSIGDDWVVRDVQGFDCISLRPYSVSHLRVFKSENLEHCFKWKRRSRIGGDTWEGFDLPLHEEFEAYSIVCRSKLGFIFRKFEVNVPWFVYSSSERLQDGCVEPYVFEVSQVSARYGSGPSRTLLVD